MGRGPVRINTYDQRATPRSTASPYVRPVDTGPGLGAALADASRAVAGVAQTEIELEDLARRRDEDDARVYVSAAMARARAQANEIRRTAFSEAPDGWRGVTKRVSNDWGQLREQELSSAPTPAAQRFLTEAFDGFQPLMLEEVAEAQQTARQSWRIDTVREAIRTEGSAIATDPRLYDQAITQQRELINGMEDLDADQRRALLSMAEEEFATVAVSAMVERDPSATLRALNNPDAEGPIAALSGAQRMTLANRAQAEIERRAARWRAQVSEQVQAAERLWELGLSSDNPPSVETVRQALGPERALAYEASREMSAQYGTVARAQTQDLLAIIGDQTPRTNERDAVIHEARRRAAAAVLEQRTQDPMGYQVRNGLTQEADLIGAVNQGDWPLVHGILRSRASAAETNGPALGLDPRPLTAIEAEALRPVVQGMPAADRGRFLRSAAAWMGGDTPSYRALIGQLFPNSPSTAYAGFIGGVGGEQGARDAALLLRGEDILRGRGAGADVEAGSNSGGSRNRLVPMPTEDHLRRAWRRYVGDAYAGLGRDQQMVGGVREAEAHAYEAFRAAYAALAEEQGANNDAINQQRANEAARIASGGIVRWNGRETLLPPGMNSAQFEQGVREGFQRYQQFRGVDPRDYNIMPMGAGPNGGMLYGVFDGEEPVRSPGGRPVEIEVRRRR